MGCECDFWQFKRSRPLLYQRAYSTAFNGFQSQKLKQHHTKNEKKKGLAQGSKWNKTQNEKSQTPKMTQRRDMRGYYLHLFIRVPPTVGLGAVEHCEGFKVPRTHFPSVDGCGTHNASHPTNSVSSGATGLHADHILLVTTPRGCMPLYFISLLFDIPDDPAKKNPSLGLWELPASVLPVHVQSGAVAHDDEADHRRYPIRPAPN